MGYTGVHYAAKDSWSAAGLLVTLAMWMVVVMVILVVGIPALVIWATVKLVQRIRHRGEAQAP